jgi:hypothetical protein
VKRDVTAVDVPYSSSMSSAGTKRSVRDRIGNSGDSSMRHGNGVSGNKRCVCNFSVFIASVVLVIGPATLYLGTFTHTPSRFSVCSENSPGIMFLTMK